MKHLKISLLLFFLCLLATAFFRKAENRTAAAYAVAGPGMLSLVQQTREKGREYPRVALTFDDGPHSTYTPMLLDGLRTRNIHATFFLIGKNIKGNEDILLQMQKDGHLIGNHTYNHVQLDKISIETACQEIQKTNNEIYQVTGLYPSFVRPPFGAWRKDMELCVTMFPVFWDIDTLDWKSKNADSVLEIVQNQVYDGSIILMHDGYQSSVDAALRIVDLLTEKGYEFVTVDQLVVL